MENSVKKLVVIDGSADPKNNIHYRSGFLIHNPALPIGVIFNLKSDYTQHPAFFLAARINEKNRGRVSGIRRLIFKNTTTRVISSVTYR